MITYFNGNGINRRSMPELRRFWRSRRFPRRKTRTFGDAVAFSTARQRPCDISRKSVFLSARRFRVSIECGTLKVEKKEVDWRG